MQRIQFIEGSSSIHPAIVSRGFSETRLAAPEGAPPPPPEDDAKPPQQELDAVTPPPEGDDAKPPQQELD